MRLKTILMAFTMVLTLLIIAVATLVYFLERDLTQKLASKNLLLPTSYFALPESFRQGESLTAEDAAQKLLKSGFRQRHWNQRTLSGDFRLSLDPSSCQEIWPHSRGESLNACLILVAKNSDQATFLGFSENQLKVIYTAEQKIAEFPLGEILVAQYLGDEPLIQEFHEIGEFPVHCLNAIMAIEDQKFLEHSGFSWTSVARALLKNIFAGRAAQGGSTITQQLVKNYLLTSERTLRRKISELIMAILLESRFDKDQILQTYLNIIYMGQNGAFRVHGYGAASQYYFGRGLSDLNLNQCSLLAAIVNSPGGNNPWKKESAATKRRNLVLKKMFELNYISADELQRATASPLEIQGLPEQAAETAPFFLQAVRRQLKDLQIDSQGKKVFTSLDLSAQQAAQESLHKHLSFLEAQNQFVKSQRIMGHSLEGVVLSSDLSRSLVTVLVGGRSFRTTQFNRGIDSLRQVGSVVKPVIYLQALMGTPDLSPLSIMQDQSTNYKFDGKTWQPANYDKKFLGPIPLYYALKNSINTIAAQLTMQMGPEKIVELLHSLGASSSVEALPSVSLGAFELKPIEILTVYSTLAQMGQKSQLSFIRSITDEKAQTIYNFSRKSELVADPVATGELVSMMMQTTQSGTAAQIGRANLGVEIAGKTGTTSDFRDAWFAGFTPNRTSVVWVGFDDNSKTNLTGASGAIPIWLEYTRKTLKQEIQTQFQWPEGLKKISVNPAQLNGAADQVLQEASFELQVRE